VPRLRGPVLRRVVRVLHGGPDDAAHRRVRGLPGRLLQPDRSPARNPACYLKMLWVFFLLKS
jgi:hypothetical protein